MVLNTSFNENEPVVCAPEEALDCFLRTKMDVLVMGEAILIRQSMQSEAVTREVDLSSRLSSVGLIDSAATKRGRAIM